MISPSQIHTWRQCQRKWHNIYVSRLPVPQTKSRALGTQTHAEIETGYNSRDYSLLSPIAKAGLKYLPSQDDQGSAELAFQMPPFHGVIDWIGIINYTDSLGFTDSRLTVIDYKTTSDFKYAKKEAELRKDPQILIYAKYALSLYPDYDSVDIRWIYFLTKRPSSRAVEFTLTRDEIEQGCALLELEIDEQQPKRSLPVLSLPPTTSECYKYGGCPFRDLCTDIKPTESLKGLLMSDMSDFLERLKNKAAAVQTDKIADIVTEPKPSLQEKPIETTIAPGPEAKAVLATQPEPIVKMTQTEAKAIVELAEAKRGPGRPLKARTAADIAKELEKELAKAQAEEAAEAAREIEMAETKRKMLEKQAAANNVVRNPAPSTTPIATLYVDCLPGDNSAIPVTILLEQARIKMREANIPHYKLVDYGKGLGMWVASVSELAKIMYVGQDVYVDSSDNSARDALEALLPLARSVVRGLR